MGSRCGVSEGIGYSYLLDLETATAVDDLVADRGVYDGNPLDRSYQLDSGGIPSSPVIAGTFGEGFYRNSDGSSGSCEDSLGILNPDLKVNLLCSIGQLKTYWYETEPE